MRIWRDRCFGARRAVLFVLLFSIQSAWATDNIELELTIGCDNSVHKLTDTSEIEVRLINVGSSPVRLYDSPDWGGLGALHLRVYDDEGNRVELRRIEHSHSGPPTPGDESRFVTLQPNHFFGTTRRDSVRELVGGAGMFRIVVLYLSTVDQTAVGTVKFWGSERDILQSNVCDVTVRK